MTTAKAILGQSAKVSEAQTLFAQSLQVCENRTGRAKDEIGRLRLILRRVRGDMSENSVCAAPETTWVPDDYNTRLDTLGSEMADVADSLAALLNELEQYI